MPVGFQRNQPNRRHNRRGLHWSWQKCHLPCHGRNSTWSGTKASPRTFSPDGCKLHGVLLLYMTSFPGYFCLGSMTAGFFIFLSMDFLRSSASGCFSFSIWNEPSVALRPRHVGCGKHGDLVAAVLPIWAPTTLKKLKTVYLTGKNFFMRIFPK